MQEEKNITDEMFFTECDLNAFCLCCALFCGLIYDCGLLERAHLK